VAGREVTGHKEAGRRDQAGHKETIGQRGEAVVPDQAETDHQVVPEAVVSVLQEKEQLVAPGVSGKDLQEGRSGPQENLHTVTDQETDPLKGEARDGKETANR
jgi:hypothetical protein